MVHSPTRAGVGVREAMVAVRPRFCRFSTSATGDIPQTLGKLAALQTLKLADNQLSGESLGSTGTILPSISSTYVRRAACSYLLARGSLETLAALTAEHDTSRRNVALSRRPYHRSLPNHQSLSGRDSPGTFFEINHRENGSSTLQCLRNRSRTGLECETVVAWHA